MPQLTISLGKLTMKSDQLCALASTRPRPGRRVRKKSANEVGALDTWIDALPTPST